MGYQGFGVGVVIYVLWLLGVALIVGVALAVLSWRYARRGDSFVALAFPVSLPLFGIVCAAFVEVPSWQRHSLRTIEPVWVGICTLAAVLIMARALWLRPGADLNSAEVRRDRRLEIIVTAGGAGLLYVLRLVAGDWFEH